MSERVTEEMVEALEAKKYAAPLAYDQSIWNGAINEAIAVVTALAARPASAEPVACPECGGVTMCRSTCSREAAFVQAVGEESDAIRRIVATLIHQVPQVDGIPMNEMAVEYIVQETRRLSLTTPPAAAQDREFSRCVWCKAEVEWFASDDREVAEVKLREHSATCPEHPAVKALNAARAAGATDGK